MMKLEQYGNTSRLLVAVDCIIFGFDGKQLKVLLIRRGFEPESGKWSLVGGFVQHDEGVDEAAARILKKLTGLSNIYMEQLHCFGDVNRDSAGRVVSVAYFALININEYNHQLTPDQEPRWFSLEQLPELIFDHGEMVTRAIKRLRESIVSHPVGFELLPEKFTLPRLQCLYEAIYGHPLDRRNFSRKILSLDILQKLDEKEKESSKKGAFLYVFKRDKYQTLAREGMKFL